MHGFTDEEEMALEKSALAAHARMDIADPRPLEGWEIGLSTGAATILLCTTAHVAAVITDGRRREYVMGQLREVHYDVIELIGDPHLTFLADQIHRCSAGALNGYRPAAEVTL